MAEALGGRATTAREEPSDEAVFIPEKDSTVSVDMEIEREKLRRCWELASVLNFMSVFEPVIQSRMKASAEEIESALIVPNDLLAQLHIALLKGLTTSCKKIDYSEAWMALLAKKLAMWWPWVAEGNFPLAVPKGQEANRYKELDPTIRLMILKALCEVRADQDDIMSYVNDAVKNENGLSTFRKEELGADVNGTFYWYDGNSVTGHRLYKEVRTFEVKPKITGRQIKPGIISQWETLATNLEEFSKVVNDYSSSKVHLEVTVSEAVQTHAIPALKRLQKKKAKLQKRMQTQEMLLSHLHTEATRRSCRTRTPVSYKFEQYDEAIEEAIEVTQKRKTPEVQGSKEANKKPRKRDEDESVSDKGQESDTSDDSNMSGSEDDKARVENRIPDQIQKVTGIATEGNRLSTKQRLRQRPMMNTALESVVVPDSEDEN